MIGMREHIYSLHLHHIIGSVEYCAVAGLRSRITRHVHNTRYAQSKHVLKKVGTLKESGVNAVVEGWNSLVAPAGTPKGFASCCAAS